MDTSWEVFYFGIQHLNPSSFRGSFNFKKPGTPICLWWTSDAAISWDTGIPIRNPVITCRILVHSFTAFVRVVSERKNVGLFCNHTQLAFAGFSCASHAYLFQPDLMAEIPNNHLGSLKPCKSWEKLPTNWWSPDFWTISSYEGNHQAKIPTPPGSKPPRLPAVSAAGKWVALPVPWSHDLRAST